MGPALIGLTKLEGTKGDKWSSYNGFDEASLYRSINARTEKRDKWSSYSGLDGASPYRSIKAREGERRQVVQLQWV